MAKPWINFNRLSKICKTRYCPRRLFPSPDDSPEKLLTDTTDDKGRKEPLADYQSVKIEIQRPNGPILSPATQNTLQDVFIFKQNHHICRRYLLG